MSIDNLLKNAKWSKEIWNTYATEEVKKYFHIRLSSYGITLVSTHPLRPMNGIQNLSSNKLKEKILKIASLPSAEDITEEFLDDLKFPHDSKPIAENLTQACMINQMCNDKKFKKELGIENLVFITSEFIIQKDEHKNFVDIVAFGDGSIFFFEVKKDNYKSKDDPIHQVNDYVNYYSNNKDFYEIIKSYPNISEPLVWNETTPIKGYGVIGYDINKIPHLNGQLITFSDYK